METGCLYPEAVNKLHLFSPLRSVIRKGDLNKNILFPKGLRNLDFVGRIGDRRWFE